MDNKNRDRLKLALRIGFGVVDPQFLSDEEYRLLVGGTEARTPIKPETVKAWAVATVYAAIGGVITE